MLPVPDPAREDITVTPEVQLSAETHDASAAPCASLVWLPAMGVPAGYYRPFAAALAERGVTVTAVDLRSQSASTGARPPEFGYRELIEQDCPAAVAWLRDRHPGLPVLVGGHSLGGQVAALYAASNPNAVSGLVLVAAQSVYWRAYGGWNGLRMLAGTQLVGDIAAVLGYWPGHRLGFGGRQPKRLMKDWARLGRSPRWTIKASPTDYDRALADLDLPVLSVSVEGDRDAPPSAVDRLCTRLSSAAVERRHHVPQAGRLTHLNWPRKAAAEIADDVATWARRSPTKR